MKSIILISLLALSGCTVALKDERVDGAKLEQVLSQHAALINALVGQIGVLQEKGYLEKPKPEEVQK